MANRCGMINVKLEAEARYVSFTTAITCDNVMEHLHFADSKNCDLLRERVMDVIVENKSDFLAKKTLSGAPPEGLINDILAAIVRGENKQDISMPCVLFVIEHGRGYFCFSAKKPCGDQGNNK